jgi:hypothetical protein
VVAARAAPPSRGMHQSGGGLARWNADPIASQTAPLIHTDHTDAARLVSNQFRDLQKGLGALRPPVSEEFLSPPQVSTFDLEIAWLGPAHQPPFQACDRSVKLLAIADRYAQCGENEEWVWRS